MPEFTKTDFVKWLRLSIAEQTSIANAVGQVYRDDFDKCFRAVNAFNRWVAGGCKDE